MIVSMKKISIVFLSGKTDEALQALRKYGAVHLNPVQPPENTAIEDLQDKIDLLKKALAFIPKTVEDPNIAGSDKPPRPKDNGEKGLALARQLLKLSSTIKKLQEELKLLESEYAPFEQWGRFDPEAIKNLEEKGIGLKVFRCHKKELDQVPENINLNILFKDGSFFYIAVAALGKIPDLPFKEIELPSRSADKIEKSIQDKQERIFRLQKKESAIFKKAIIIRQTLNLFTDYLNYEIARAGLGTEKRISYITGFCPDEALDRLKTIAAEKNWAVMLETPNKDDPVPTLVTYSKWSKLFKPVMNFIGVTPGYWEYDANNIILLFFSIFYALLIGDAGYGSIMLLSTYLIGRYFKRIPKETIYLFYLLSGTTILWGAITGLWFGVEAIGKLPGFKVLVVPALYSFADQSSTALMHLCFIIALVQLSIAHLCRAIQLYPSLSLIAEMGRIILIWGIYCIAKALILNTPMTDFLPSLIIIGTMMVIIFGEQNEEGFIKGILKGIIQSPSNILNVIGSFSDLVSYIRLFAVGLAAKEVAVAFNNLSMDVGFGSFFSILGASLILLFGHAVNILLGAMSVLVHGIRLNFLEFSKHLNLEWSGIPYKPFKSSTSKSVKRLK